MEIPEDKIDLNGDLDKYSIDSIVLTELSNSITHTFS
ncbi:phosphopantetheine-binding protein [Bacillus cereus]